MKVRGQISILDLAFENTDYKIWAKVTGKTTNLEDYLKKGIKITSLQREIKSLELVDVPLLKYLAKKGTSDIRLNVAKYLKHNFIKGNDEFLKYIYPAFNRSENIPLNESLIKRKLRSTPKRVLCLGFEEVENLSNVDTAIAVLTDNCPKLALGRYYKLYGDAYYHHLIKADYLADVFIYYYIKEIIEERKELKDYILINVLKRTVKDFLKIFATDNNEIYLSEELKRFGMDDGLIADGFTPIYLVDKEVPNELRDRFLDECHIPASLYLKYATSNIPFWYIRNGINDADGYLKLLIREHMAGVEIKKYLKTSTERAAVYQTKKNIPLKIIEQMQDSKFNDFFGYVEFDQLCKVDLVEEIAREFTALKKLCLDPDKHEDVQIRFRLLGNYHAWGLYFPKMCCICVDIRHPGSLCHEYMHMLDFQNGELSMGFSFQKVFNLYKEAVTRNVQAMSEDNPLLSKLNGKSKFNLQYYLTPTEVFARCGEIYLRRHLDIRSSLLNDVIGFAYPEDKDLYDEIVSYYGEFFKRLRGEEEKEEKELPALVASV